MISHDNGEFAGFRGLRGFRGLMHAAKYSVPRRWRRQLRRAQRAVSYVPRQLLGTITSVHTDVPAVALTFDDGPSPVSTPQVLEVLEAHGARATFFLLGRCAERHPDLVARIVRGGHAIGN